MARRIMLISFVLVAACLLATGIGFAKPAGVSAFLPEYADSPKQVVDQMEANRLVALRYARVFVSDPRAVLTYFRNELTLTSLDEPMEVRVHRLDEEGRIVNETKVLKAGTRVFANRTGYPVLEFGTGNPLTSDLPAAGTPKPKSAPLNQAENPVEAPSQPTAASNPTNPAGNPGTQSVLQPTSPSPAPETPLVPSTPGETIATVPGTTNLPEVVAPKTEVAGVQMSSGGGSGLGSWLVPAGLAGAVAALAGGGGGGSSPVTGGGTGTGGDPASPPVVPEPASLMALGSGLIALGGLAGRRRRR